VAFRSFLKNSPFPVDCSLFGGYIRPAGYVRAGFSRSAAAMKGWTIGKKLFGGVGTLSVLLLLSSGLALFSASMIFGELERTGSVTTKKLTLALEVNSELEQAYSHAKSMVLYGTIKNAKKYTTEIERTTKAAARVHDILAELKPMVVVPEGKQALAEIEQGAQAGTSCSSSSSSRRMPRSTRTASRSSAPAAPCATRRARRRHGSSRSSRRSSRRCRLCLVAVLDAADVLISVALASLAVAGVIVWVVRGIDRTLRNTASELRDGAQQTASAATQVAGSAQGLSRGSSEQAASLEETSASMGDGVDDAPQRRELRAGGWLDGRRRPRRRSLERGARRDGAVDAQHRGVQHARVQDHQDDRRDRVPDEHPGAQRGRRGRARRRGRDGLRGRRR
jgi:hypothetical protein